MDLTTLVLATSFAQGWSKWFVIGGGIGLVIALVIGAIVWLVPSDEKNKQEQAAATVAEEDNEQL